MRKTQGRWNLGLGWVPIGLLETTGRRTGRTYQTPLLYDAFDSYLYLVASSGGSPKHPTWYWNAKDRPVVFYRGGQVLRGHMEETDGQDYADAWNRFRAFNPGFDTYNERVDRHIPILRMKI
ncbi:MAG: nitroreductase/quinone reductase family protein [Pseudomonadota bacterium]